MMFWSKGLVEGENSFEQLRKIKLDVWIGRVTMPQAPEFVMMPYTNKIQEGRLGSRGDVTDDLIHQIING